MAYRIIGVSLKLYLLIKGASMFDVKANETLREERFNFVRIYIPRHFNNLMVEIKMFSLHALR